MEAVNLKQISTQIWEILPMGNMRVPGRIYANQKLMETIRSDESVKQVANVAQLPGIVGYALAMPDIHWGYGFPIGGVAAFDLDDGIISPGGVGYDINCGVRLIGTHLSSQFVRPRCKQLLTAIFGQVPTGVGSHGAIRKLSIADLKQVIAQGAGWAVQQGYGSQNDLESIEDRGYLDGGMPDIISARAYERGANQMGTLGSGNHFIEISEVNEIYDANLAQGLGLRQGNVTITIHTGSRGFGYQICDDFLKETLRATTKYGITIPDRQLACTPLNSTEGRNYLGAMRAAANFAFANRQVICALIEEALLKALSISPKEIGYHVIWDIAHNIAKIEEHQFQNKIRRVCVHRKGATRAFGPGHPDLPAQYQATGQPVLVPGDMGRESYVCVGTARAMCKTFGSACHGAGRLMSRHQALTKARGLDLLRELENAGVVVLAEEKGTIAEEMPFAYKNVTEVVETMHAAGITKKVARLTPIGVIKG